MSENVKEVMTVDPTTRRPDAGSLTALVEHEGPKLTTEGERRSSVSFRPFDTNAPTPAAFWALDETFDAFLRDVKREIERACMKFPHSNAVMCALTEEVGELAKAMMDEPKHRVWAEAIQVAAMAARAAVEGDPTLDATRAKRGADATDREQEGAGGGGL